METNKLCEILHKQAIDKTTDDLQRAAEQYQKSLGLYNEGTKYIVFRDEEGKEVFKETFYKILGVISSQLIGERSDKIKAAALKDFMDKFKSFNTHLLTIEQYAQDMMES